MCRFSHAGDDHARKQASRDRKPSHELFEEDEHDDRDKRAQIEHAGVGHHAAQRVDDGLSDAKEELVERAGLIDGEPAQQRTRDDSPNEHGQEELSELGDVGIDGGNPGVPRFAVS